MPRSSYELTRLDANTFEHLVNALAIRVLGPGHTGFGPGKDGGRDGLFEGTAPYPSATDCWSGVWYIQSKFLTPHLSKDPQRWLLDRISEEIAAFQKPRSPRAWPNNWIIATNIEPSGAPETGCFDRANALVKSAHSALLGHFHIWGGRKILDLLSLYPEIGSHYAEFITAGSVLTELYKQRTDSNAQIEEIIRYLVVTQFDDHQYTRLEQAGSTAERRPGIQKLFSDLPFLSKVHNFQGMAAHTLSHALAANHTIQTPTDSSEIWREWQRHPLRSRVWFIKGGPGQGKSTLTQYISQIQRAALILNADGPKVLPPQREVAEDIHLRASRKGLWPLAPRTPLVVDLKEFASWFSKGGQHLSERMISFLSDLLTAQIGETVRPGTLRRAFGSSRWLFVFDGLDEVPSDTKDDIAREITHFVNDALIGYGSDAAIIFTSRPQGYSGQFAAIEAATVELISLSREQALACAEPLLGLERSESERREYVELLRDALESESIAEIMTTPLQAHIMAVIVRDGGKPPERKWQLFNTFYEIIRKREANRNLPDKRLATLLREGDKLLKALHNRLGFELHARAETSQGAVTSLSRDSVQKIVTEVVTALQDKDISQTVQALMSAATERLVLVSTPETSDAVRFDIRPLQEFFAGEYVYQSGEPTDFVDRVKMISGDSHWREVVHFLFSALIENNRRSELAAAISVLIQMDEGGERRARILNRRLARGGIVTARLLQEGVLEQDKRVREQFRTCLLPLLSCVDAADFLEKVNAPHSIQWLTEVLDAALQELAEPETAGAATSLSQLLSDKDPRCEKLKKRILSSSIELKRFFVKYARTKLRRPSHASRWIRECALEMLMEVNWWKLGRDGVSAAIEVFSTGPGAKAISIDCGLPDLVCAQIDSILTMPFDHYLSNNLDHTEVRYGIIEAQYFRPTLKLDWQTWPAEMWSALRSSGGILFAIYKCLRLAQSPSATTLREFVHSIGGRIQNFDLLPETTSTYLNDRAIIAKDKLKPIEAIENVRPGHLRTLTLMPNSEEKIEWANLIMEEPWIALYLLATDAKNASDSNISKSLLRKLPTSAILSHVPRWGSLFSIHSPLGADLRKIALRSAADDVQDEYFLEGFHAFPLNLPKEAEMLPHLLGALIFVHRSGHTSAKFSIKDIPEILGQYTASAEALVKINLDRSLPKRTRAAAAIMALIQGRPDSHLINSLLECYEKSEAKWLVPAAAIALSDRIVAADPEAESLIGSILEFSRNDFAAQDAVNAIILEWRETSRAPVSKFGTLDLWSAR